MIASRKLVGGLIIHSGFASGLRLVYPEMQRISKYDLFPTIEYIKYVECPILIMHGNADQQININ